VDAEKKINPNFVKTNSILRSGGKGEIRRDSDGQKSER
jgi:hypothetical protein